MDLATMLIIIHASLGGVGLVSGIISMASKKGRSVHKTVDKVFVMRCWA